MMPILILSKKERDELYVKSEEAFEKSCHGLIESSYSMSRTGVMFCCELLGYEVFDCSKKERKERVMTVTLWLKGMLGPKKKSRGDS